MKLEHPIARCAIAVRPVVDGNGAWFLRQRHDLLIEGALPFHAESDVDGNFEISNTIDGPSVIIAISIA